MTTLPSKFEMKRSIHYCLLFFFFFPPSFLHAIERLGLEGVSAKTLGVVLAGKGRRVLGGYATQIWLHCLLCIGTNVPSVKLFSDFSLSSSHSFPFRCLCSKIKPLWSLHQRFGVYNNTAMVVTLNLRQHHDTLFFCKASSHAGLERDELCFSLSLLFCLFSSPSTDCSD